MNNAAIGQDSRTSSSKANAIRDAMMHSAFGVGHNCAPGLNAVKAWRKAYKNKCNMYAKQRDKIRNGATQKASRHAMSRAKAETKQNSPSGRLSSSFLLRVSCRSPGRDSSRGRAWLIPHADKRYASDREVWPWEVRARWVTRLVAEGLLGILVCMGRGVTRA